ncbi:hypothetical protein ElyMa_004213900 [Elysia marginata]|uniref:Uncharacterized protein n=1 Tax=Elysia marginata TaxID=1093978 RepID=A0AAV4GNY8_9GAST|nr:hypothetical protein ElyMa_004213900 [Elysia marginata]
MEATEILSFLWSAQLYSDWRRNYFPDESNGGSGGYGETLSSFGFVTSICIRPSLDGFVCRTQTPKSGTPPSVAELPIVECWRFLSGLVLLPDIPEQTDLVLNTDDTSCPFCLLGRCPRPEALQTFTHKAHLPLNLFHKLSALSLWRSMVSSRLGFS